MGVGEKGPGEKGEKDGKRRSAASSTGTTPEWEVLTARTDISDDDWDEARRAV